MYTVWVAHGCNESAGLTDTCKRSWASF